MMIMKNEEQIGEYLIAILKQDTGKTLIYKILNINNQISLGLIKWNPAWRQYCFFPESDCIFSTGCMNDIIKFIDKLKLAHQEKMKQK